MALIILGRARYIAYSQIQCIMFVQSLIKAWHWLCIVCAFEQQVRCEWLFGLLNACHLGSSCLRLTAHYRIPTAFGSPLNSQSAISWTPHPAIEYDEKVWQQQSPELIEIRSRELQSTLSLITLLFQSEQCFIIKIKHNCIINNLLSCLILTRSNIMYLQGSHVISFQTISHHI